MAAFTGKIALVTGGGSGIGAAAAEGLAAEGAQVVIAGRRMERLAAIAAKAPGAIRPVTCDVSDGAAVAAFFADITAREGGIGLLVNAAGIYTQAPLASFDMEEWRRTVEVNLIGAANCIHGALPGMLERDHGRIVTLGSRSAYRPGAVTSAYSASKAGVEALSLAVAHEILWRRGYRPDVHTNVLIPGQTITGLLDDAEGAEPGKYQSPADVWPFIRALLLRGRRAPMGQVIYRRKVVSRGDWKLRAKILRANLRGAR